MTNSLARTVAQWREIYATTPAPRSAEEAIASRVIADLWGYRSSSKHRAQDVETLQNAIVAYAQMLHEHGVKP